MRTGLLSELVNVGYDVFVDGNTLKLSYRKPGDPPQTVRPLIQELKTHKAEVLALLKNDTGEHPPLWANPNQRGTREARRASLDMLMDEIILAGMDRIKASLTHFTRTPAFDQAEHRINEVRRQVFAGRARIEDYQKAVDAWARAAGPCNV